ncbi:FG-GAP repeat domain-containing protein [Asanoa siamensis]|uniref:VCBS repeat protein n=1 Tax=Asanoa siamensis TaxID=926357 RepID=A0ABQ4CT19_9ACTN|nr:VCBS repeat-containing protein [Asanoa siamensis]GIF74418.1 hypothetical protein Asi02nite_39360 [Asanoa siamensis]
MNRYGAWRVTAVVAAAVTGVAALPAMASADGVADFLPPRYLSTGAPNTDSVAVADVTGDRRPDILVGVSAFGNGDVNALLVYAQQPDRGYGAPRRIVAHGEAGGEVRVAVGDLDGDGRTDAALSTRAGVDLFYQRSGNLTAPVLAASGSGAADVALADMDGDRRTDLVVSVLPGTVTIHRQASRGVFAAPVTLTGPFDTGAPGEQVFVADLNGDARPDVAQFYGKGTWVRLQRADGTFAPASHHLVAPDADGYRWPTASAAVGDVTGDGRVDLVMATDANVPNSAVNVFAGRSGGPTAVPSVYPVHDIPAGMAIGDLTGDGRADLAVAHHSWQAVSVSPQRSDGTLGAYGLVEMDNVARSVDGVAVADVSGDGRADIISTSYMSIAVIVHR